MCAGGSVKEAHRISEDADSPIFSGRDSIEMVEFSAKMILGQPDGISDFVKVQIRVVIIGIQIILGQCNTR